MKLTKKSETSSKITFTYDKPSGPVEGYLYFAGGARVARTFNPNDLEVTFGKVASGEYAVEAIGFNVIDRAEWPDAPPTSEYGADIPPPPVTAPVGTRIDVASLTALRAAIAGSATWIRITQPISVGGDLEINRRATAAAPLWLEGGSLNNCRVLLSGATYVRLDGIEVSAGWDGIKATGGAANIVLNKLNVHDTINQGLLATGASNLHVLNTRFVRCGYGYAQAGMSPNQTHSIYLAQLAGGVLANVLSDRPQAYSLQVYPGPLSDILVTGFTSKGGITRGGMVVEGVTGLRVVGYVCEDAPSEALTYYGGGAKVYDSIRWNSGAFSSGPEYVNCIQANPAVAAKGHVQPARYGLLPPNDIDGKERHTADAGCFAYV